MLYVLDLCHLILMNFWHDSQQIHLEILWSLKCVRIYRIFIVYLYGLPHWDILGYIFKYTLENSIRSYKKPCSSPKQAVLPYEYMNIQEWNWRKKLFAILNRSHTLEGQSLVSTVPQFKFDDIIKTISSCFQITSNKTIKYSISHSSFPIISFYVMIRSFVLRLLYLQCVY